MPPYSGNGRTYCFLHQESLSDLSRRSSRFSWTPLPRAGAPTWLILRLRCLDLFRTQAPHICAGTQSSNIGPPTRGCSITRPSCFGRYRQYHCCSIHQQTGWDPFQRPVAAGSRSVSVATDSGHNFARQTHSGLPHQEVNVHVSTVSPAQKIHSEAQDHSSGRGDTHSPLVAITTVVSTFVTSVCGPPMLLSVPPRPAVTTGIYLKWQVYHLHTWRLSCCTTKQQDFQKRSLSSPQLLGDPLQIESTMTDDYASLTGPQGKDLIHLVPQLLK